VRTLIIIGVWGRVLVVVGAIFPRAEQRQIAGEALRAIFSLPALLFSQTRGLNLSLNVKLGTFGNAFADDFRQKLPGGDVVPLGPFLPFVVAVFEPLWRG
jgi:hypothetical protein